MALRQLSEEMMRFEEYLSVKRLTTIDEPEGEYDIASPDYVDRACVFSAIDDFADVTTEAVTLGSLCTAVVRFPAIGSWVAEVIDVSVEDALWYGDNEIITGRLELEVTSRSPDNNKTQLQHELLQLYKEYSVDNWDGYNSEPVSRKAYLEAEKFIAMLPSSVGVPDIVPEPNGEIAFEWYRGKGFAFIVSIGGDNAISFAGLFGKSSKIHGTEYFGDKIPDNVIRFIHRLSEGTY